MMGAIVSLKILKGNYKFIYNTSLFINYLYRYIDHGVVLDIKKVAGFLRDNIGDITFLVNKIDLKFLELKIIFFK
jgi:hypothetical protein